MARIPSLKDVADLSRDEWERLCRSLAVIIYQAEGVEDRKGKGNGLDAIRIDAHQANGWQFRRFDGRLGDPQIRAIRDALELAVARCKAEDGVPLGRFAVWANIDLEPGHMSQTGERERVKTLKAFARSTHGVELEFVGVTWVHTQLLMHPQLRPDLFEDISAQIEAVHSSLKADTEAILASIKSETGNKAIARLAEQALVHFQRGQKHGINEEFRYAENCLVDALNLLDGLPVDALLEGKVLIALAGVRTVLGRFDQAIAAATGALNALPPEESFLRGHAFGNMGIACGFMGDHKEARRLHQLGLDAAEERGDAVGVVVALTHLLELEVNTGRARQATRLADRLTRAVSGIEGAHGGASDVSLAARGALAGRLLETGLERHDRVALEQAITLFGVLAELGLPVSLRIWAGAQSQRARAIWNLDRLAEAETIFLEVLQRLANADLPKVTADVRFNLALVKYESGKGQEAIAEMERAEAEYRQMGDRSSQKGAEKWLIDFRQD